MMSCGTDCELIVVGVVMNMSRIEKSMNCVFLWIVIFITELVVLQPVGSTPGKSSEFSLGHRLSNCRSLFGETQLMLSGTS